MGARPRSLPRPQCPQDEVGANISNNKCDYKWAALGSVENYVRVSESRQTPGSRPRKAPTQRLREKQHRAGVASPESAPGRGDAKCPASRCGYIRRQREAGPTCSAIRGDGQAIFGLLVVGRLCRGFGYRSRLHAIEPALTPFRTALRNFEDAIEHHRL
jgi:hypothetical protein